MTPLPVVLGACIGSHRSVGAVRSVRAVGTSLYVYSERGSVKRSDLREIPTYLGTDLDVWCWITSKPPSTTGRSAGEPWAVQRDHDHDLERHEFRVVDQRQKFADLLFNESRAEHCLAEELFRSAQ